MNNEKFTRTVRQVVDLLVEGRYSELEALSEGRRLSASELERAVDDYGHTLIQPGEGSLWRELVEISRPGAPAWSLYVDLWTREEGRSDLTLELTLSESDGDLYQLEIDDLHVL